MPPSGPATTAEPDLGKARGPFYTGCLAVRDGLSRMPGQKAARQPSRHPAPERRPDFGTGLATSGQRHRQAE